MSDYYFLKFTDLPLGLLCFYNQMGKKSKTIKSKGKQKEKTRADCCSDRELLVAKFRLKLKKVGKTTRHSGTT